MKLLDIDWLSPILVFLKETKLKEFIVKIVTISQYVNQLVISGIEKINNQLLN